MLQSWLWFQRLLSRKIVEIQKIIRYEYSKRNDACGLKSARISWGENKCCGITDKAICGQDGNQYTPEYVTRRDTYNFVNLIGSHSGFIYICGCKCNTIRMIWGPSALIIHLPRLHGRYWWSIDGIIHNDANHDVAWTLSKPQTNDVAVKWCFYGPSAKWMAWTM